jgi:exodeoxyribonuclease (lambda-induced)
MVEESLGERSFFENDAMRWGKEHEAEAARLYAAMYAGRREVKETGFWSKGDIGASPDRLVGDEGLLEIKCPYSLRDEVVPEFRSYVEQKHYWHQIQAQLYVTDRQWCDFLQWTPNDHKIERVIRDDNWLTDNAEAFASFMEDYHQRMEQLKAGGPAERLAMSAGWEMAVNRYAKAKAAADQAKEALSQAQEALVELVKAQALDEVDSDVCKVQKVTREGSVKWKDVAAELAEADVLAELSEKHKGKGSEYYKIDLKGDR